MSSPFLLALVPTLAQATTAEQGLLKNVGWGLLAAIVLAFVIFGIRDVGRLSWTRIRAISSVCFKESVRRRVLWITPLAILGAIVVGYFQNPVDPQDAIRQTTKVCLFTSGLVVTLVAIILASTNLPKEIDNRVIFTIVTKPTTRLEIVLGKVWGFAKVSGLILVIMGVFTLAYLHVRAWRLNKATAAELQTLPDDSPTRETLSYYQQAGLLNAKVMTGPQWMQIMGHPQPEADTRWMLGAQGQRFTVRFHLDEDTYSKVKDAFQAGGRGVLSLNIPTRSRLVTPSEGEQLRTLGIKTLEEKEAEAAAAKEVPKAGPPAPSTGPTTGPTTAPSTAPTTAASTAPASGHAIPVVGVSFHTTQGTISLKPADVNDGTPIDLPVADPQPAPRRVPLSANALDSLFNAVDPTATIEGSSPGVEYGVGRTPVTLDILAADGSVAMSIKPVEENVDEEKKGYANGPMIRGSIGRYGEQLIGGEEGFGGFAVFHFKGIRDAGAGALTFEIKTGIERSGESETDANSLPTVELRVRNPKTGKISDPATFRPEVNRISFKSVPRSAFPDDGGDFDVLLRVQTPDRWLGVQKASVLLATESSSFPLNLAKSLFVLWLMSILVTSIAIFCSTFLSWPIAVVLTLVLLLGRWGVDQIGDVGAPGLGAQITGQTEDPAKARLIRGAADFLSQVLAVVSVFLPDISSFQATTDIERGISMPMGRLGTAGISLAAYGLPMVMLAYLFLKRKEVAP